MSDAKTSALRELFVEELAEITGGGDPIQYVKDRLGGGGGGGGCCATTYACCEEGPDNCCDVGIAFP